MSSGNSKKFYDQYSALHKKITRQNHMTECEEKSKIKNCLPVDPNVRICKQGLYSYE